MGDVVDIGMRSTRIITLDNRMVIVPNSQIGKNQVVNYTAPDLSYMLLSHFRKHQNHGRYQGKQRRKPQQATSNNHNAVASRFVGLARHLHLSQFNLLADQRAC